PEPETFSFARWLSDRISPFARRRATERKQSKRDGRGKCKSCSKRGKVSPTVWLLFSRGSECMDERAKEIRRLIIEATSAESSPSEKQESFREIVTRFQDLAFACSY